MAVGRSSLRHRERKWSPLPLGIKGDVKSGGKEPVGDRHKHSRIASATWKDIVPRDKKKKKKKECTPLMWLSERNLAVGTAMYKDVTGRGGDEDTEKVSGASPGPGPGPGTA